ncbi:ornithine decarboxylase-like [Leguminivora glycinivorella]|uniref:ornithine decarboxylase-like n=1 Tax=Leguminivora glycinivorella TaxID=1035111 RepID=UPI00200FF283|nr:ornithine decarboxylase-like [Leguminivora glycinivorella]
MTINLIPTTPYFTLQVSQVINEALETHFPDRSVRVIAEPGRYLAAAAYSLAVMIYAKREIVTKDASGEEEPHTMYFMNSGIYSSFYSVPNHNQRVKPTTLYPHTEKPLPCSLWGPTCDSRDCVMPSNRLPPLPVGFWLLFRDMGAYIIPVATDFNGFPLPTVRTLVDHRLWSVLKGLWPLVEAHNQCGPPLGALPLVARVRAQRRHTLRSFLKTFLLSKE